jgi:thioredoxin reductase (NADPH)
MEKPEKPIVTEEVKKDLTENFRLLREPVTIAVFTKEGVNDQYNKIASQLIAEIAAVDERISVEFHHIGDESSTKYDVERSPTILIAPDKYRIRFTGTPLGEEGRTLVLSIILASTAKAPMLSTGFAEKVRQLTEKRDVRVFVSPT